jgi:phenylpropionate dioxygenase-like ring-hydroxylating dioxygenase large terminal subunit
MQDGRDVFIASAQPPSQFEEIDIGDRFECPLHGWTFDKTTGRSLNAAGAALVCLETAERRGRLYARLAPAEPCVSTLAGNLV